MSDVLAEIEGALARKGMSAAKASELAVGNPSLIKNLRNGQGRFSYEALRRLASVLDLECYFGPPRHDASRRYDGSFTYSGEPQPPPLSPALRHALRLDEDATELDALERIAAWPKQADAAMRLLADEQNRRRALADRLAELQQVLAAAIADLRDAPETGLAEPPPPAFAERQPAHAGFAEPPPARTPAPRRRRRYADPNDPADWIGGEPPPNTSDDQKD